jgi:hypothetical protein
MPWGGGGGVSSQLTRSILSANQIYYVNGTTGNDANNGLTSGTAWATMAQAMLGISQVDFNGYAVTVQVADGTYASFTVPICVGQGGAWALTINGNSTTPSNVVFTSSTQQSTFNILAFCSATIQNCLFSNTHTGTARPISNVGGHLVIGAGVYVGAGDEQIFTSGNGMTEGGGPITVTAGGRIFCSVAYGGVFSYFGTMNMGTTTYTGRTFYAQGNGCIECPATFTGTVTGQRYFAEFGGIVQTYSGNANYLPGNAAGGTATGGQYN